jgi:hypothetical protein
LAGVISGTGIVYAARGLHEPWSTLLALVGPTIAVLWAFAQAAVFEKLDEIATKRAAERDEDARRRAIAELKAALADAQAEVQGMPPGEARTKREEELKQAADAIAGQHIIFLRRKLDEAALTQASQASGRSPRNKPKQPPNLQRDSNA